jgi:hypothetical protein
MARWNLALRFALELATLTGLAVGAWKLTSGNVRWIAVIAAPVAAAAIWGVFNVLDDPSRSGAAPVPISGWVRLAIEIAILGGGVGALVIAEYRNAAAVTALLIVVQYVASWRRLEWLVQA